MARTLAQIEQVILDAKDAEVGLNGLNSTSKTAIWRLWVKVVATAQFVFETLIDLKIQELKDQAAATVVGTDKWYADRMLEFQYGHSLSESNGRLFYLVDDEAARIIKKVATGTESGLLKIKVAKEVAGVLTKLTDAEKVAADSYVQDIKFAGTSHIVVSQDPDLVKITRMKVYYDGKLVLASFQTLVEDAINTYLRDIYFNGYFNINAFRDAVEAVEGAIGGPDIDLLEIKPTAGSYTPVIREYNPASGYFSIDPAFPLSDSAVIEYIPA